MEQKLLTPAQLAKIVGLRSQNPGKSLLQAACELGCYNRARLVTAISSRLHIPAVRLGAVLIEESYQCPRQKARESLVRALQSLPAEAAVCFNVLPYRAHDVLVLITEDPMDSGTLSRLKGVANKEIRPIFMIDYPLTREVIMRAYQQFLDGQRIYSKGLIDLSG